MALLTITVVGYIIKSYFTRTRVLNWWCWSMTQRCIIRTSNTDIIKTKAIFTWVKTFHAGMSICNTFKIVRFTRALIINISLIYPIRIRHIASQAFTIIFYTGWADWIAFLTAFKSLITVISLCCITYALIILICSASPVLTSS